MQSTWDCFMFCNIWTDQRLSVRILFVDFSSAFNTIIPNLLLPKLTQLSVLTFICEWINSFLTDKQQLMRLVKYTSSTGAPQGCALSPLLFSLYTNDCTSKDLSVKLLKFADDTTLISLIQDGDESAYRQEAKELAVWCNLNNLELNTLKTVETPLLSPHSPSWTALWLQRSHSDSWAQQYLRTWSGTFTSGNPSSALQWLSGSAQLPTEDYGG